MDRNKIIAGANANLFSEAVESLEGFQNISCSGLSIWQILEAFAKSQGKTIQMKYYTNSSVIENSTIPYPLPDQYNAIFKKEIDVLFPSAYLAKLKDQLNCDMHIPVFDSYSSIFSASGSFQMLTWQFTEPFSTQVWLLFLLFFVLSLFIPGVQTEQKPKISATSKRSSNFHPSLGHNIWSCLKKILGQDCSRPRVSQFRSWTVFTAVAMQICLIIFRNAYSGFLASVLTFRQNPFVIDGVQQLMTAMSTKRVTTFITGQMWTEVIRSYANDSKSETWKRLQEITPEFDRAIYYAENPCHKLARDSGIAFAEADELISRDCDMELHTSKAKFGKLLVGPVTRRGVPYVEPLRRKIRQAIESGLNEKWTNDCFKEQTKNFKSVSSKTVKEPLTFKFYYITSLVFCGGMILSIAAFLTEMIHGWVFPIHRKQKKKERKKKVVKNSIVFKRRYVFCPL